MSLATNEEEALVIKQFFMTQYNQTPQGVVKAPGRVNIIGEHIDYNGYPVLPVAMRQSIYVAFAPNTDNMIRIQNYAPGFNEYSCEVSNVSKIAIPPQWYDYVLCGIYGVQKERKNITIPGINFAILGKIPMAAGLSSSSALVCGTAVATNAVLDNVEVVANIATNGTSNGAGNNAGYSLSVEKLAQVCSSSEKYVGTEGGGMDQAACLLSQEDCAQLISFHPLKCTAVSLPKGATFVVANSNQQINKAATSDFNHRVVECKLACSVLAKATGEDWEEIPTLAALQKKLNKSLDDMIDLVKQILHDNPYTVADISKLLYITERNVSQTFLSTNTKHIDEFKLRSRALHVFSESKRVYTFKKICDDWKEKQKNGQAGDASSALSQLGAVMLESHASARDDYECSHPKLDKLVELSRQHALGARLTGAGWGGCTVALVMEDKLSDHKAALTRQYYDGLGLDEMAVSQALFASPPAKGATILHV